jgi:hypothetical protein
MEGAWCPGRESRIPATTPQIAAPALHVRHVRDILIFAAPSSMEGVSSHISIYLSSSSRYLSYSDLCRHILLQILGF